MRLFIKKFLFFLCCIVFSLQGYCAQIFLSNGDRITGSIESQSQDTIVISNDSIGRITIPRDVIQEIVDVTKADQSQEISPSSWDRTISLGYNKSGGNNQNSQLMGGMLFHKKTACDEFHFKGEGYYSSSQRINIPSFTNFSLSKLNSFSENR